MASTLKVDTIESTTGTSYLSAGTLDNVTLGSSVTGTSVAGNQILISTQTADASASITFSSSSVTDTYDDYILDIADAVPSISSGRPRIAFSIDNSTDLTGCYSGHIYIKVSAAETAPAAAANVAYAEIGQVVSNVVAEGGFSSRVLLHGLRNTYGYKYGSFLTISNDYAWYGGFKLPTTSAINYLRFFYSNGNIAEGVFNLYGIKK